jgi:glucose dehydrogenase
LVSHIKVVLVGLIELGYGDFCPSRAGAMPAKGTSHTHQVHMGQGTARMKRLITVGVAACLATAAHAQTAQELSKSDPSYVLNYGMDYGQQRYSAPAKINAQNVKHLADDKARFMNSVTHGKNNRMPPWGDILKSEDIDNLWAYLLTGGKP